MKESISLDSFKAALDDFMMALPDGTNCLIWLPDTPPTPGYIAANNNNLLDWIVINSRAFKELWSKIRSEDSVLQNKIIALVSEEGASSWLASLPLPKYVFFFEQADVP